ncbi:hypothetical protein [Gimesia panareensis]|uniref:hypothetical protein n=1 Tax=Gimesia panareensis TaxID=2527978 RepID=UPI00119DD3E8|nr:hypothetical protein [Gimesia panareensis]
MQTFDELKAFLLNHDLFQDTMTIELKQTDLSAADDIAAADDFVQELGLIPLGDGWTELDQAAAQETLTLILHLSQAYHVELLPLATAEQIAKSFLELFDTYNASFYSNGTFTRSSSSWNELTEATFDMAVLVMDHESIGIICVEDED